MQTHKKILIGLATLSAVVLVGIGTAQPQGGQRGQRGAGGRGGFGNRSPEEFRQMMEQRMAERMKEQLGIGDDEWKVLQPRLRKVMELSAQSGGRSGMMGGMGRMMMGGGRGPGGRGPGGRGPQDQAGARGPRPGGDQPQNDVQKAAQALRTLLEGDNPSTDQIKAKLAALRAAREKAKQELVKAQTDLRQLLTLKQEATLVMMSILP